MPSRGQVNPGQSTFDEWLKWDPISSGEGDLPLDDMEKSFFSSDITKKSVKTIDFTSTMNGLPAHGLQIKDLISGTKAAPEPPDTGKYLSDAIEIGEAVAVCEKLEEPRGLNSIPEEQGIMPENHGGLNTLSTKHCRIILPECQASSHGITNIYQSSGCQEYKVSLDCVPKELVSIIPLPEDGQTSLNNEQMRYQASGFEDSEMSSMPIDTGTSNIFSKFEESSEKLNYTNDLEEIVVATETQLQDRQSQMCGGSVLPDGGRVHITTMKAESITIAENHASIKLFSPSSASIFSALQLKESIVENSCDVGIYAQEGVAVDQVPNKTDSESKRGQSLASSDVNLQDIYIVGEQYKDMTDSSVILGDKLSIDGSFNLATNFNDPVSENVMGEWKQIDSVTRFHGLGKLQAGGERRKRNSPHQPFLFPFKRFLKPSHFKRKARKLKPLTTV